VHARQFGQTSIFVHAACQTNLIKQTGVQPERQPKQRLLACPDAQILFSHKAQCVLRSVHARHFGQPSIFVQAAWQYTSRQHGNRQQGNMAIYKQHAKQHGKQHAKQT
jgi:hypothetical protein